MEQTQPKQNYLSRENFPTGKLVSLQIGVESWIFKMSYEKENLNIKTIALYI